MDHSQSGAMAMPMGEHGGHGMAMNGALGRYAMERESSGTAWQPDASAHIGLTKQSGEWMLMAHGVLNLVYDHQSGPRGDDKEAWDNIDVTGFMGQRMQIKVNFLCKDSILAAPLVIEIARVLDLANKRGDGGVQEQLSTFFKAPMVKNGHGPEHAFGKQEKMLHDWLGVH